MMKKPLPFALMLVFASASAAQTFDVLEFRLPQPSRYAPLVDGDGSTSVVMTHGDSANVFTAPTNHGTEQLVSEISVRLGRIHTPNHFDPVLLISGQLAGETQLTPLAALTLRGSRVNAPIDPPVRVSRVRIDYVDPLAQSDAEIRSVEAYGPKEERHLVIDRYTWFGTTPPRGNAVQLRLVQETQGNDDLVLISASLGLLLQQPITLPGWFGGQLLDPFALLPLTSDNQLDVTFPYEPAFQGAPVHFQSLVIDLFAGGQDVYFSRPVTIVF